MILNKYWPWRKKRHENIRRNCLAVKDAFAGRLCQGFATGKKWMPIVLLYEFEKVVGEGLNMMLGNALDIKKNKNWQDQFLGFEVQLCQPSVRLRPR